MQANKQVSFFSAGEVPMFIQVKDRPLKKSLRAFVFFSFFRWMLLFLQNFEAVAKEFFDFHF